jgi:predicted transcriptional regulator
MPRHRFPKGNKLGGNKKQNHTIQAEALKKYLIEEVIKQKAPIIKALIREAKKGNVAALKEVLERILGRVTDTFVGKLTGELVIQVWKELAEKNGIKDTHTIAK